MRSVNLLLLAAVTDEELFEKYEKQLSFRTEKLKVDFGEINAIRRIIEHLKDEGCKCANLDGFFYAFKIPQIGKEFDLLRIDKETVLNIEIKSQSVSQEAILSQLKKNKYYLSSLNKVLKFYTYDYEWDILYCMTENEELKTCTFSDLYKSMCQQTEIYDGDISSLFKPSDYLISPLNTPEKFLNNEYFLTGHQEEIKKKVIKALYDSKSKYFGITGGPGTGKTLLLYDLARELSESGNCLLIHCGILSHGHTVINGQIENLTIISAKQIQSINDFSHFQYIFFDEGHRIYLNQFQLITAIIDKTPSLSAVFSYDINQVLSKSETKNKIAERISVLPSVETFELTGKIRTNPEIASFIKRIMDLKSHDIKDTYPSINLNYAENSKQLECLLKYYKHNGYTFISYTGSIYNQSLYDGINRIADTMHNTHHIIGQEFDKVVMVMGSNFKYNTEGKLQSHSHPYDNYLYRQLLFQGLTRTRERLAIIVWDNKPVFKELLSIVQKRNK